MNRKALRLAVRQAADRHGAKTELAKLFGLSRQRIGQKLREEDGFTEAELLRAAAALGVDPSAESRLAPKTIEAAVGAQARPFDEALLVEAIVVAERLIELSGRPLPPDRKAHFIANIYNNALDAREKDNKSDLLATLKEVTD